MGLTDALLAAVHRAHRPRQTMRFADIAWGDSPRTVENKLRAAGFTPGEHDGDDVGFTGTYASYDGHGWVYMSRRRAVKVMFVIRPEPDQVLGAYDWIDRLLVRQYGRTPHRVESFMAPYASGDGRELEALRAGKATIAAAWKEGEDGTPLRAADPGVILRATSDLAVRLSYESAAWGAEAERRKASAPAAGSASR